MALSAVPNDEIILRVLAVSEVFSLGNTFLYSLVLGASVK